jgi:hypothetical protein
MVAEKPGMGKEKIQSVNALAITSRKLGITL